MPQVLSNRRDRQSIQSRACAHNRLKACIFMTCATKPHCGSRPPCKCRTFQNSWVERLSRWQCDTTSRPTRKLSRWSTAPPRNLHHNRRSLQRPKNGGWLAYDGIAIAILVAPRRQYRLRVVTGKRSTGPPARSSFALHAIKEALLGPAQLYEALRERYMGNRAPR
jgi:hypothetical protein